MALVDRAQFLPPLSAFSGPSVAYLLDSATAPPTLQALNFRAEFTGCNCRAVGR